MRIIQNISLAPLTTFGVGGSAQYFSEVTSEAELQECVAWAVAHNLSIAVLGGGSNVLVPDSGVPGLVLRIKLTGRVYDTASDGTVLASYGAGEVFDEVVQDTVDSGWWGIENLSHIPGSIGAAPIQNIGAYGVEIGDVLESVRVFDYRTNTFFSVAADDCQLGYRTSIFKSDAAATWIVVGVTLRLQSLPRPRLGYADMQVLGEREHVSLTDIRTHVIAVRGAKFPDWTKCGTAGSFFKNPIIESQHWHELKIKYPELPGYKTETGTYKVALGWILDHVCGLRGVRDGRVGTYKGQALVLVAEKGATASEIDTFAQRVREMVLARTGITIEPEVTYFSHE